MTLTPEMAAFETFMKPKGFTIDWDGDGFPKDRDSYHAWTGWLARAQSQQAQYSSEPMMNLSKVADDIDAMCTCRHCDEWVASIRHHMSQRAVGVEEFNEGDRVVWTNNHGTAFPATIYAKGIGYHLHLDDGTEITTSGNLRALIERAGGGVCL